MSHYVAFLFAIVVLWSKKERCVAFYEQFFSKVGSFIHCSGLSVHGGEKFLIAFSSLNMLEDCVHCFEVGHVGNMVTDDPHAATGIFVLQ